MDILICALLILVTGAVFVGIYRLGVNDGKNFYEDDFYCEPEREEREGNNGWENIISYSPEGHER